MIVSHYNLKEMAKTSHYPVMYRQVLDLLEVQRRKVVVDCTLGLGSHSEKFLEVMAADSLLVEQRMLSAPASIQSIPAAADQEDFVSMGMNTALKNNQILDNAYAVLGIEFMAAAQALDFREYKVGKGVAKAKEVIRRHVDFLDEDRPLYPDHTVMKELVRSGEILVEVEEEIGTLE